MKLKAVITILALFISASLSSYTVSREINYTHIKPGGKWVKYKSENGKARISFPVEPEISMVTSGLTLTNSLTLSNQSNSWLGI